VGSVRSCFSQLFAYVGAGDPLKISNDILRSSERVRSCARVLFVACCALSFASAAAATPPAIRWGSPGSGDGELHSPFAVAVHQDRVYVSDFDNDRIQAFTREGKFLFAWGGPGSDEGQFHGPTGLAIDAAGSILVADHYNHRIQKFTPDGRFLAAWSAGNTDAAPVGLAIDRANRIYATDLDAGQVRVWSVDGKLLSQWGGLAEPWGIAIDARDQVWVAEHGRDRLVGFNLAGQPLAISDANASAYLGPMAVAAAKDGTLLASDFQKGILQRTTGIAVDASGSVWVADPDRNQIARYVMDASTPDAVSSGGLRLAPSTMSRGQISLRVMVPSHGTLSADVFSPAGRLVWSAPRSAVDAGEHVVNWNGRTSAGQSASSGIYFVRVRLDDANQRAEQRGRIVLIR
jgi:sugar lactone lactonase YvrE